MGDAEFTTPSGVTPVPDGKLGELPFRLMPWEDFEKLTLSLGKDVHDLADARRYGTSGQAQHGIDVVGHSRLGRQPHGYQSKQVDEFTEDDLKAAISKYVDGKRPFELKVFVVAVSVAVNRKQAVEALEAACRQNPGLDIELWDAPKLNELLRDYPLIVERFFGETIARRFCFSTSFPPVPAAPPTGEQGGVSLDVIMRGPVRALDLDSQFNDAVNAERGDPATAAAGFTDIARRLSQEGYTAHAGALRRRAVQAYTTAERPAEAIHLQLRVIADAIMSGRWPEVPGLLHVLHRLADGDGPGGGEEALAVTAVVGVLDVAGALVSDPMLLPQTTGTAAASLAPLLAALPGALPAGSQVRDLLLLAAGAAVVCVTECAIASESFSPVAAIRGDLEALAGLLGASGDAGVRHLGVRLRLAVIEARSPDASDGAWDPIQQEATSWVLNDGDAALVLARYARARAVYGAAADADTAWRRAAEFASRARLFADIGGWMAAQIRLRFRYGPAVLAEIGDLRQMISLLGEQHSPRITPVDGLREEVLDALRGGDNELRTAALAAQRLRVLAAAAGLWEDELLAHGLLADVFVRSGEPLLAEFHRVRQGNPSSAKSLASQAADKFLDITPELERPAPAERSATYAALAAQAELIPDDLVTTIAEHARADIVAVHAGTIKETPFSGTSVLVSAAEAAAAVAGRVPTETARALMVSLDPRLDQAKGTAAHTDNSHLSILVAVAAGEDDDLAAEAEERLARLLALESPMLRTSGRELSPVVTRRPGTVRSVLTALARQGSAQAAELLCGWSLTGPPGRAASREPAEESAWQAALPYADAAAKRLASLPAGEKGKADLFAGLQLDAGLVTILDPEDADQALSGLLRFAADPLHLAPSRQLALNAASILVAGDRGDQLGQDRLASVFDIACEYARGEHDGSAMDDITGAAHPLSAVRISMGDATLAADGLCLAVRASRTPAQHAVVADLAVEIARGHPSETVIDGVAHALAALPSLPAAPHPMSVTTLARSDSQSLRAIGALHWALASAPASTESEAEADGDSLAHDPSPLVRRSLARQLAIVAGRDGLSHAGRNAATILAGDPRWDVRRAADDALAAAASTEEDTR
jgi:hypothetical protein